jgi:hypothetical protein
MERARAGTTLGNEREDDDATRTRGNEIAAEENGRWRPELPAYRCRQTRPPDK